jgi:DNA-binding winged helix-turn-helix (wHTH) protein
MLLGKIWGGDYTEQTEYLRVFVRHLRKKIEADPAKPRYILTEPWVGYRFVAEPTVREGKLATLNLHPQSVALRTFNEPLSHFLFQLASIDSFAKAFNAIESWQRAEKNSGHKVFRPPHRQSST